MHTWLHDWVVPPSLGEQHQSQLMQKQHADMHLHHYANGKAVSYQKKSATMLP